MSEMASISCRQGRVPSASMMFSILRAVEETADMTALEYHESLIRERRTWHKPRDAKGVVVEVDKGNSTFRRSEPTTPLHMLPVIDSNDETPLSLIRGAVPQRRPHRFRI